jgi:competence protein ComEC
MDLGDGVTAVVLNPPVSGTPYGTGTDDTTINNYSAVLRLTYGQTHFLLTGDAEFAAEDNIMATGADISADVLKVGHHGAGNATSNAWLAHVRPCWAAISCGLHNSFGHPAPATIARLAAHRVTTYCTAWNGAITFTSNGRVVTAHPFKSRSSPMVTTLLHGRLQRRTS